MTNFLKRTLHFIRKYWKRIILGILSIMFLLFLSWKIDINQNTSNYFMNNFFNISIVVLIMMIIFTLSSYYNFEFDDDNNKKVTKTIIVEKMTANKKEPFSCQRGAEDLEKDCKKLYEEPCQLPDCCAWGKKTGAEKAECIAGTESGPIFKTDENGKKHSFDYYYYKNKKILI